MSVIVTKEEAMALNELRKNPEDIQYALVSHCKGYSGNGILVKDIWVGETAVLNKMPPLKFAEALINGFTIEDK